MSFRHYLSGRDWLETRKNREGAGFRTPPVMVTVANRTETAARVHYALTHGTVRIEAGSRGQWCADRELFLATLGSIVAAATVLTVGPRRHSTAVVIRGRVRPSPSAPHGPRPEELIEYGRINAPRVSSSADPARAGSARDNTAQMPTARPCRDGFRRCYDCWRPRRGDRMWPMATARGRSSSR
jgi:hypothetical protein